MLYTQSEVLQYVQENDVKFIRLAFCDLLGRQKNLSIRPDELPRALDEGIAFDAGCIRGFACAGGCDLLLRPDSSTLNVLPWRPLRGRVVRFFCDIFCSDGNSFALCGWQLLARVERECKRQELSVRVAPSSNSTYSKPTRPDCPR